MVSVAAKPINDILKDIEDLVNKYIQCCEKRKPLAIEPDDKEYIFIREGLTPCDEKFLIHRHYNFHELPLEVLRKLAILLIKTHVVQNVNYDHIFFWAWTAQLVVEFEKDIILFSDPEIRDEILLLFRLNLLPTRLVSYFPELYIIVSRHFILSAHIAFSLLERILKLKCSNHVKLDGIVTRLFTVPISRHLKSYKPGNRVNRVGHLLYLFENNYASSQLKQDLRDYRDTCIQVYSCKGGGYGYYFIDDWRNRLLHGEKFWSSMSAAIVNLISLLLLHEIPLSLYNKRKSELVVRFKTPSEIESNPFIFYPPKNSISNCFTTHK